jgi:metal-dependent HD superfamily phosphatase/phosphodiesterase
MSCNATETAIATLHAPACCNLGNYIHDTSHRAQSMALICDIFDKTALPFIKFKDLKIM